jgi:hypothetical protein
LNFKKLSLLLQAILGLTPPGESEKCFSETQISYRRGGAKGKSFYHLRGIQLLIFAENGEKLCPRAIFHFNLKRIKP